MKPEDRTKYVAHEADDAKKLVHDDYLRFAEEATARIIGANPDLIAQFAKQHDGDYATDYEGHGGTSHLTQALCPDVTTVPDLVFETKEKLVLAEAKSTLSEVTKKGFVNQIYGMLRLACSSRASRRYIILSVPFSAIGEAKYSVARAMRQLIAAEEVDAEHVEKLTRIVNGQNRRRVEGAGSMAISFDPAMLMDGEIGITYVSEIDGKALPSPTISRVSENMGSDKAVTRFAESGYVQNSYEDLGGTRYPVMQTILSIDDERLVFDPRNNRLLGSDRTPLSQEECFERLLSDGDVDFANREDAHQRRREILQGLSIHKALDVFLDADGSLVVVDGNSRMAAARYILAHAAAGSAAGFRDLKANVFSFNSGVSREEISAIKNARQHETKVDHDTIQDAFIIYEQKQAGWKTSSIRTYFGGRYGDPIINGSAETIRRLKEAGYGDEDIKAMYHSMWYLSNAGIKKPNFKGNAVSTQDWEAIARRLATEKRLVDSGSVQLSKSYLNASKFSKTVVQIMKATRKSDYKKQLMQNWLNGEDSLASPDSFIAALQDSQNKRTIREIQMERVKRIQRDLDALNAFLREVDFDDADMDVKQQTGMSMRDLKTMSEAVTEMNRKARTVNALNKVLGAHVRSGAAAA